MTLEVTDTYTDIDTADSYLVLKNDWLELSNESKQEALLNARMYIDENFSIDDVTDVSDLSVVPDALQFASSLLAYDSVINGDLFVKHTTREVFEKSVKAGSVMSSKKYKTGQKDLRPSSYGKVKVLLSSLYTNLTGVTFLVRS